MAHDVFICHSNHDSKLAGELYDHLTAAGIQCWISSRSIPAGEDWPAEIIKGIKGTRLVLLLWSSEANQSQHVKYEIGRASHNKRPILAFKIEDFAPSDSLEYFVSTSQWLSAWDGQPQEHFPALLSQVRAHLSRPVESGTVAPRSPTPHPTPRTARRPMRAMLMLAGGLAAVAVIVFGLQIVMADNHDDPNPGGGGKATPGTGKPIDGDDKPQGGGNVKGGDSGEPKPLNDPPPRDEPRDPKPPKVTAVAWGDFPTALRAKFEPTGSELIADDSHKRPARIVHVATKLELIFVPGGSFSFGADASDNAAKEEEMPAVPVRVSGFYMGRTEVTCEQWQVGGGAAPPACTNSADPVTFVTWEQARRWCVDNAVELPTEIQWEYAASGHENRLYPWSGKWVNANCNSQNHGDGFPQVVAPVGQFPDGASWCGVLDLAGNVQEWCSNAYTENLRGIKANALDPVIESRDSRRVARGGAWSLLESSCRTSSRARSHPGASDGFTGLRVVLVLR